MTSSNAPTDAEATAPDAYTRNRIDQAPFLSDCKKPKTRPLRKFGEESVAVAVLDKTPVSEARKGGQHRNVNACDNGKADTT